ncbi:MAG: sigma-70 family RNA polymerase sigma factor [Deltaproteobacteria bacterium]|nr:sigma-70 family RNA polymerase sigma factor [Deltaproteobacteria bacterium]
MPTEDVALLLAWRAGDRDAGGDLIERYAETLLQFFRNKVSGPVDDLVQQTFLTCVEHRDDVRDPSRFRAYLLTVARRVLLEHYRVRSRDRHHFDPLTTSVWDVDASPSSIAADRQERQLLVEALRRIPLDFQVALELYYWQDLSGPELCEVLALPEGTVRSRLRRGRELLRSQIEALAADNALLDATLGEFERWADAVRDAVEH